MSRLTLNENHFSNFILSPSLLAIFSSIILSFFLNISKELYSYSLILELSIITLFGSYYALKFKSPILENLNFKISLLFTFLVTILNILINPFCSVNIDDPIKSQLINIAASAPFYIGQSAALFLLSYIFLYTSGVLVLKRSPKINLNIFKRPLILALIILLPTIGLKMGIFSSRFSNIICEAWQFPYLVELLIAITVGIRYAKKYDKVLPYKLTLQTTLLYLATIFIIWTSQACTEFFMNLSDPSIINRYLSIFTSYSLLIIPVRVALIFISLSLSSRCLIYKRAGDRLGSFFKDPIILSIMLTLFSVIISNMDTLIYYFTHNSIKYITLFSELTLFLPVLLIGIVFYAQFKDFTSWMLNLKISAYYSILQFSINTLNTYFFQYNSLFSSDLGLSQIINSAFNLLTPILGTLILNFILLTISSAVFCLIKQIVQKDSKFNEN